METEAGGLVTGQDMGRQWRIYWRIYSRKAVDSATLHLYMNDQSI